ncbi:MAG: thiamine-phosphate kinase [Pseudoclavibacter sp.]
MPDSATRPEHPDARGDATSAANAAGHAAPRTVGEAGEAGMLARILPRATPAEAAIVPTGDDAAVVAAPDGRYVVTTDLLVEGPDFRRAWHEPHDLGWKACSSNLADVAAMGARPTALVVALAVPDETPLPWIEAFGAGFAACLGDLSPGAGLVGGDLSSSSQVVISVTAFGDLEGRAPVLRSGARPGDVVALAGDAGRSASGLSALFAGQVPGCSTEEGALVGSGAPWAAVREAVEPIGGGPAAEAVGVGLADLVAAVAASQFAPSPPISAGPVAARAGATAMMDVSDGLLLDASRLARASGVVVDLDTSAFAVDAAWLASLPGDAGVGGPSIGVVEALERCLTGGEDHALLATFPAGAVVPEPFRRIGTVREAAPTASGSSPVFVDGAPREALGWDPYS